MRTQILIGLLALIWIVDSAHAQVKSIKGEAESSVVENLEIQHDILLFVPDRYKLFTSGANTSINLNFFSGYLRTGISIGFGKYIFKYSHENLKQYSNTPYLSTLDFFGLSSSINIGTDFLPKRKLDIILASDVGLLVPFKGEYNYYKLVPSSSYPYFPTTVNRQTEVKSKVHPTLSGSICFRYPIGKRSIISAGYRFCRILGTLEVEQTDVPDLPNNIGNLHQAVVSYCFFFNTRKATTGTQ